MDIGDTVTHLLLRGLSRPRRAGLAAIGVLVLAYRFPDILEHGIAAEVQHTTDMAMRLIQPGVEALLRAVVPAAP